MRNIENFFRGEIWLHIATMFFLMVMLMQISLQLFHIYLPNLVLLIIPIVVGITWEVVWNKVRGNPINLTDITATIIGGYLAILILRI